MKQFNVLIGTVAAAALTLACVDTSAEITSSKFEMVADSSSAMRDDGAAPALGGEGDGVPGGNAPNPEPDRTVSTVVDDAGITGAVKAKLLADTLVSGLKIDVDTRAGVVYLTGDNMNSQAAIDQAVKLAKETSGVKTVESKLAVGDIKS
jgi:BON domain